MNEKELKIANWLRKTLVESLRLPMEPEDIEYSEPLFGEGLGLDSVDMLEIVAAVDQEYGIPLSKEHKQYFESIETLSKFIYQKQQNK